MITAIIIDDLTSTTSNKNQEYNGQCIVNIGTGLLGGMAGYAMIVQSMIKIKSGGRSRLSILFSGVTFINNEATTKIINKFAVHNDPNLNKKLLANH